MVQELCKVLISHGDKDDFNKICLDFDYEEQKTGAAKKDIRGEARQRKPIPCYSSMLTKKLSCQRKK